MAIVIDANLVIARATDDGRAGAITALTSQWTRDGQQLNAPALLRYEVAHGLSRMIAAGAFAKDDLSTATATIRNLSITYHPLDDPASAVEIALRLGRRSAYNAADILIAQQLRAEPWTFNGPLARNAGELGLPVRLNET